MSRELKRRLSIGGIVAGLVIIAIQLFAMAQVVQGQVERAHSREWGVGSQRVAFSRCDAAGAVGAACRGGVKSAARRAGAVMDLMSGQAVQAEAPLVLASGQ